ncbi:MAG: LptF/LptG family permease [Candidatus Hydrothermae bacterium]|nr:LptF/LptG family permease [Candidatus Hydrothermae bacterium]MDD3649510.1 LptF/LptG family permease [Candidatus Hydrothermia bacterium]MDD5572298.1 LptF/LptG family permease [Candidatus Hydrothermia bacterium]HOK23441.1 LptF/LptG family permease [Candidatus Hydrothermia bacterium]HOL23963.1 LptF/LptG family permease [Candidatus Hydrothermia bacterium]
MKKVDRLYFSELIRLFIIFTLGSVFIFIFVNFFERLGFFISNEARPIDIFLFYFYQIPYLINLLAPFAFLISIFFLFQQSVYNREVLVLKISGCDIRGTMAKILAFSLILSVLIFFCEEYLSYPGLQRSTMVRKVNIEKNEYYFYYPSVSDFSFMNGDTLFYFSRLNARERQGRGVVIMVFDTNTPRVRIDADSCLIINNDFELFSVIERHIGPERDSIVFFERKLLQGMVSPFEVLKRKTEIEQMSSRQLYQVISYKRRTKLLYKEELVELLYRFSFPLTIFVFTFFSLPMALSIKARGKAFAFGTALVLSFLLWALIQFFKVSGQAGKLSAPFAAFMPLFISLLVGVFPWMKLRL